jgi:hypothetical protein
MTFPARNVTVSLLAAASGLALSLFISPAFAQGQDSPERNHVNAAGAGRYVLKVAPGRQPDIGQQLLGHVAPILLPLQ